MVGAGVAVDVAVGVVVGVGVGGEVDVGVGVGGDVGVGVSVGGSRVGFALGRDVVVGVGESPPNSEIRLLRFVMTDGHWLAVASEPINSDEYAPSSQSTCA